MRQHRAARRYALALIAVAAERKTLEGVSRDCRTLGNLISANRDFAIFLQSPVISTQKKRRILSDLLAGRIDETTLKFVQLVASHGREGILSQIVHEFFRLSDERNGVVDVTTSVAVPFTSRQDQRLAGRLQEATKKSVRMNYVVEPSLIGGFTVRLEDTVWDASVRRELELLRRRFVEGNQ